MDWDAIGAIGEVLGALAVVGSLVYLAIQIRSSTKLAKAQMFQHRLVQLVPYRLLLVCGQNFPIRRLWL